MVVASMVRSLVQGFCANSAHETLPVGETGGSKHKRGLVRPQRSEARPSCAREGQRPLALSHKGGRMGGAKRRPFASAETG